MERTFNGDNQTRFVVACKASTNGQIKYSQEEELVDAN